MARSLRAGHALTSALQLVGEEIQEPVGGEFRALFERQNFGMSLADALREFAARVPLVDARFFVTAVLIQRESGGNLSQVLDNLSSVIRERFKVKRQVRVMSAHGRITGWALGMLPPGLALILFAIAPDHISLLVTDPLGRQMLMAAVVLQVIGVLIIRRIVDVEF
jgi:tight adherence protein B